jgi:hypothetical protein
MNLTPEQLAAAKTAQSPEELKALADEELDAVSGGSGYACHDDKALQGKTCPNGVTLFPQPLCRTCQYIRISGSTLSGYDCALPSEDGRQPTTRYIFDGRLPEGRFP